METYEIDGATGKISPQASVLKIEWLTGGSKWESSQMDLI